jgi:hypothetical protein
MRKIKIILVLGIWTAILPYLGFPDSWKTVLFSLTGLGFIFLSYLLYKDNKTKKDFKTFDSFKENVEELIEKI